MRLFFIFIFITSFAFGQQGGGFYSLLLEGDTANQVNDMRIVDITNNTMSLTWDRGSYGDGVIILAKSGAAVNASPADATDYTSNAAFGSGDQIGTGNYVVYKGIGTGVTVTSLTADTRYHYKAFSYTGSGAGRTYLKTWTTNFVNDKSFTDKFDAVVDFAVSSGYSYPQLRHEPLKPGQVDINYWVSNRQANSSFNNQDAIYLFKLGNSALSNFATINYINPATFQLSGVNSPSYGINGWTYNGTNSYHNTGYVPSSGTNLTLDDAGAIISISAGTEQLLLNDFGAGGAGANPFFALQSRRTSSGQLYNLNNSASANGANSTSAYGYWQMRRTASNAIAIYRNGVSFDSDNNASTSRPGVSVYLGTGNINGVAGTSTDRTYNTFELGSSQNGKELANYNFWTSLTGTPELTSVDNVWIEGDYAYVTSTDGDALEIIDISNPLYPRHVSKILNGEGGALLDGALGVMVVGNYCYVTSISSNALEIIDVTNKYHPIHAGSIVNGAGGADLSSPWNLDIVGNYAYICTLTGFEIVDITTPASPTHVGKIANGAGGAALDAPLAVRVVGSLAYLAVHNSDALEIIDVSVPATPVHVGKLLNGSGGALLDQAHGIHIIGNYAIITSRASDALEIVDITVPALPVHYSSLTNGTGGANLDGPVDLYVVGDYAYIASYDGNALEIVDISDLSAPVHAGKLINGQQGAFLLTPDMCFVSGFYVYVTARFGNAVEVINIANPANPIHAGKIFDGE